MGHSQRGRVSIWVSDVGFHGCARRTDTLVIVHFWVVTKVQRIHGQIMAGTGGQVSSRRISFFSETRTWGNAALATSCTRDNGAVAS
jgi:hypothetical protein